MERLAGRTCLITGASSGLGAHFARLIAGEGARVVLGARRKERTAVLADELARQGAAVLAIDMDVTDEASVCAGYDEAQARFGPIDTVIANAGVSAPGRSVDIAAAEVQALLATNVLGLFLTAREGARRMIAAGSRETAKGRVVLIGSVAATVGVPGETVYCASKAAVASLGRNLAREWVRLGVNVNTVQPGFILTEMTGEWFASDGGKAQIASFPRRRLQPIESLDEPVVYFCSDACAQATGAILTLDDGQSL
jgi:NAD(P)-dependent dehydrogenase (short-subunit alcohol dehydrogenase family)